MKTSTDPEVKRRRLLQEARELFLELGYHKTSLRAVCSAAGVTTGTLYHHFSGKDELFVEVCVEGMRSLNQRLKHAGEMIEGRPSSERMIALFDAYLAWTTENHGYFVNIERIQIHREELNISSDLAARVDEIGQEMVDDMVQGLMRHDSNLNESDALQWVLLAIVMTQGLVSAQRRTMLGRYTLDLAAFRQNLTTMIEALVNG